MRPKTVLQWLLSIVIKMIIDELDAEDRDAAIANKPAYSASAALVSAPLSSIFGSALPSLVDDDSLSRY